MYHHNILFSSLPFLQTNKQKQEKTQSVLTGMYNFYNRSDTNILKVCLLELANILRSRHYQKKNIKADIFKVLQIPSNIQKTDKYLAYLAY